MARRFIPPTITDDSALGGNYDIERSLIFLSGDSTYLRRTPSSSGNRQKFTISLWWKPGNSDENICVGDGKDLKIYHDGNSVLYDNGTGDFNLFSNGGAIKLKKDTGENMIVANTDGAVEIYHDNEKRLYTDSDGVTIGQSAYCLLYTSPSPRDRG